MKFKLQSLLALIAISACALGWVARTGWFAPDFEHANNEIRKKLEQPTDLQMTNWTAADLASHLRGEYQISTSIGNADANQVLDDLSISSVRLKNCIRLALRVRNLSYAIKKGRLEFVGVDDPDAVKPQDVYSQGDFAAPAAAR